MLTNEYFPWNHKKSLDVNNFLNPNQYLAAQERRYFNRFCEFVENNFELAKMQRVHYTSYDDIARAAKIPDSIGCKGQGSLRVACTLAFVLEHYTIEMPSPRFRTNDDMRAAFPFLREKFDPFLLPFANWYAYSIRHIRVVASKSCLVAVSPLYNPSFCVLFPLT